MTAFLKRIIVRQQKHKVFTYRKIILSINSTQTYNINVKIDALPPIKENAVFNHV